MPRLVKFTLREKGKLAEAIVRRDKKFRDAVKRNFVLAGDDFIEGIRQRWYSGRKGGDVGLNRVTSKAHDSWTANVREQLFDIVAMIQNGMKYTVLHENGTKLFPKRTFVRRDLKEEKTGKALFSNAVRQALREAF